MPDSVDITFCALVYSTFMPGFLIGFVSKRCIRATVISCGIGLATSCVAMSEFRNQYMPFAVFYSLASLTGNPSASLVGQAARRLLLKK
jgi:hypothetical protein